MSNSLIAPEYELFPDRVRWTVAVTREQRASYGTRHPGPEDLLLVVEVSDTSLRTDLVRILDLNQRQLHIYRNPTSSEYESLTIHAESEIVYAAARPDAPIMVGNLLPQVSHE